MKLALRFIIGLTLLASLSCEKPKEEPKPLTPEEKSEPAPLCSSRLNLPTTFADRCSGGSNLSLCLMSDKSQCDGKAQCLFHNRSGNPTAYCTVACNPADKSSCPKNFACLQEGCDNRNVCARIADGNSNDGFVLAQEFISRNGSYNMIEAALLADGSHIFTSGANEVLVRSSAGQWKMVNDPLLAFGPEQINLVGGVAYLSHSLNWGPNLVTYIDGKIATVVTPRGTQEIYHVFESPEGALALVARTASELRDGIFKRVDGVWEKLSVTQEDYNRARTARRLGRNLFYSFDSKENMFSISNDMLNWRDLDVITNDRIASLFGFAMNDVWVLTDSGKVHRWNGRQWVYENALPPGLGKIEKLASGKYVASLNSQFSMIQQNGCWQKVPAVQSPIVVLGDRAGYVERERFTVFDPNFVPGY